MGKKHRPIIHCPTSKGVSEVSGASERANGRASCQYFGLYSWLFSTIVSFSFMPFPAKHQQVMKWADHQTKLIFSPQLGFVLVQALVVFATFAPEERMHVQMPAHEQTRTHMSRHARTRANKHEHEKTNTHTSRHTRTRTSKHARMECATPLNHPF